MQDGQFNHMKIIDKNTKPTKEYILYQSYGSTFLYGGKLFIKTDSIEGLMCANGAVDLRSGKIQYLGEFSIVEPIKTSFAFGRILRQTRLCNISIGGTFLYQNDHYIKVYTNDDDWAFEIVNLNNGRLQRVIRNIGVDSISSKVIIHRLTKTMRVANK